MRHFNVTGLCTPDKDYMVDISDKIQKIRGMVDMEEYFTINRARQYGKTTTLQALKKNLNMDYIVSRISFEGIGGTIFSDEAKFCLGFDELFGKNRPADRRSGSGFGQSGIPTFSRHAPRKISGKESK